MAYPGGWITASRAWPAVNPEVDFVRACGRVVSRRRGGVAGFVLEHQQADARNLIRVTNLENLKSLLPRIRPVASRYYFDGLATARYDVMLVAPKQASLGPLQIGRALKEASFKISFGKSEEVSLYGARKILAVHQSYSRLRGDRFLRLQSEGLFSFGEEPLIYSEQSARESALRIQSMKSASGGAHLHSTYSKKLEREARIQRILVARLWCELHVIRRFLRTVARIVELPEFGRQQSDAIQEYINAAERRLRSFRRAVDDEQFHHIYASAAEHFDAFRPGEIETAISALEGLKMRPSIWAKVETLQGYAMTKRDEINLTVNIAGGTNNIGQIGSINSLSIEGKRLAATSYVEQFFEIIRNKLPAEEYAKLSVEKSAILQSVNSGSAEQIDEAKKKVKLCEQVAYRYGIDSAQIMSAAASITQALVAIGAIM